MTIADLRNKRVSLGIPEAGGRFCSEILLSHFGLSGATISDEVTDVPDALEGVLARRIDASIIWRGLPGPGQTKAFETGDLRLVPLEPDAIEGLRVKSPFLMPWTIPPRVFPHQDSSVSTVSARMLLLVARSLPTSLVEEILGVLAARMPDLIARHPAAADINVTKRPSLDDGLSIDLHPGAERFFASMATR